MIILRYLNRQIFQTTAAITLILLVVAVLNRLIKYLSEASAGELDSSVVVLIMAYRLPQFIQLILPLALLLGILHSYGRMYADSEMTVLQACGISNKKLLAITMCSATVIGIIIAGLALYITPWSLTKFEKLLQSQAELSEFELMVPGVFQPMSGGQRTTYTQDIVDQKMFNVFMHETLANRDTAAASALPIEDEEGRRFMVFNAGSLKEGITGSERYTITAFDEFGLRMPDRDLNFAPAVVQQTRSTLELLASNEPADTAELQWRISLLIIIPILTLIAIPLSKVNPRQGKYAKLLPAIAIYMSYFGLLFAAKDLIEKESVPALLGLWWVHVLFAALAIVLFLEKMPKLAFSKKALNIPGGASK